MSKARVWMLAAGAGSGVVPVAAPVLGAATGASAGEVVGGGLTLGGWFTMLTSVGFVTVLTAWCIWKVLTTPGETEKLHSQLDIDPGDREP
jgi:hypothetical protein